MERVRRERDARLEPRAHEAVAAALAANDAAHAETLRRERSVASDAQAAELARRDCERDAARDAHERARDAKDALKKRLFATPRLRRILGEESRWISREYGRIDWCLAKRTRSCSGKATGHALEYTFELSIVRIGLWTHTVVMENEMRIIPVPATIEKGSWCSSKKAWCV